jgi:dTDP-4-dehydrorhamnose reductase
MLGRELSAICKARGDKVAGFARPYIDITDRDKFLKLAGDADPEIIYHCAAFTAVDKCETEQNEAYLVNATGTQNACLAAESLGVPLVYISTDYIFDGTKNEPYDEWDAANPISVYGKSKYAGETFVRALCPWFYIVRTSWLVGAGRPNFVDTILRLAKEKDELKVVSDQQGSPTFVKDLAHELLRLTESGAFGTYHIANTGYTTWFDFASKIVSLSGLKTRITPCATEDFPRPAPRPKNSRLSARLYENAIGNEMPDWEAGLREYLREAK